jgi:hypothetical protein
MAYENGIQDGENIPAEIKKVVQPAKFVNPVNGIWVNSCSAEYLSKKPVQMKIEWSLITGTSICGSMLVDMNEFEKSDMKKMLPEKFDYFLAEKAEGSNVRCWFILKK